MWTGNFLFDLIHNLVNTAVTATDYANFNPLSWFTGLLQALPQGGTFPAPVHSFAQHLGGVLADVSFILPVHDLVTILYLIVVIRLALVLYYLVKMGILFIRGVSVYNRL